MNFLTAVHNENSYQYCGIGLEFDLGIWLPAIPVVSIGFYFVTFGFHQWGLILFEIITIFFEKLLCFKKKVGTK